MEVVWKGSKFYSLKLNDCSEAKNSRIEKSNWVDLIHIISGMEKMWASMYLGALSIWVGVLGHCGKEVGERFKKIE